MNLKENCQYIFNKNTQLIEKNSKNLTQNPSSEYSQIQACSVLFQISNSYTQQPLQRKIKKIQQKKENTYSPWRQYKNRIDQSGQQRAKKNYLSTNKNIQQKSLCKKQKRELSMKILSQVIQFPLNDEVVVQRSKKRCSYFQKCKTNGFNQKDSFSQQKFNNFSSQLNKIENAQSKSVQVLHLQKHKDILSSTHKQRSAIILPNYRILDNKPNIIKDKFKINLLKRRLNKKSNKSQNKQALRKQENIDLVLGNMLRQKLKNGMLNVKDVPKNCTIFNQKLFQKINGFTKTQDIYKIK